MSPGGGRIARTAAGIHPIQAKEDQMSASVIEKHDGEPSAADVSAESWVAAFAEGWRAPSDPEAFAAHFRDLLSPEIRLIQPQLPTMGKD